MKEWVKQIIKYGGLLDLSILNEEGQKIVRDLYSFVPDQCNAKELNIKA